MSPITPPDHFICPMTLEVMSHPYKHKDTNFSFERESILAWMYFGQATCPMSRIPLRPQDFVDNVALRTEIDAWKSEHGIETPEDEEEDQSEGIEDCQDLLEAAATRHFKGTPMTKHREAQIMTLRDSVLQRRDAKIRARTASHSIARVTSISV